MGHFKYLHGSRMICLPLNIFQELHWQYLLKKIGEAEPIITFISVNTIQNPLTLKKNIDHSSKRGPTSSFHSDTSPALGHSLVHDVRCSKWPRSFFCSCLSPVIVHLPNLVFFSAPVAQMLLTQKDVKICEKQMKRYEILIHKYMTTNSWR